MEFSSSNRDHAPNDKEVDFLPWKMDHLPEVFRQKAELELSETAENKVKCVQELTEMIKTDKTLNDVTFHEDFLHQYLRNSKYDAKKAYARLRNFIFHHKNKQLYVQQVSDQVFERTKNANCFICLPKRLPSGQVIFHVKYGNWDPNEISIVDLSLYVTCVLQQALRDPMTQINGVNSFPVRYHSVHSLNHPAPVKFIWVILRNLLSEKLRNRFIFHSKPEDLLDHLPASVVPVEYGGELQEAFTQSTMHSWLEEALQHQKNSPLGGHSNYY